MLDPISRRARGMKACEKKLRWITPLELQGSLFRLSDYVVSDLLSTKLGL